MRNLCGNMILLTGASRKAAQIIMTPRQKWFWLIWCPLVENTAYFPTVRGNSPSMTPSVACPERRGWSSIFMPSNMMLDWGCCPAERRSCETRPVAMSTRTESVRRGKCKSCWHAKIWVLMWTKSQDLLLRVFVAPQLQHGQKKKKKSDEMHAKGVDDCERYSANTV